MNKTILILTLLLASLSTFSQEEDYIWRLGYFHGIDFNNAQADTFSVPQFSPIGFTNSGICGGSGNLLFYTNGVTIFNSNSDTMMNGSGLNPTAFTVSHDPLPISQASIVIQRPDHSNEYYLFHETIEFTF